MTIKVPYNFLQKFKAFKSNCSNELQVIDNSIFSSSEHEQIVAPELKFR